MELVPAICTQCNAPLSVDRACEKTVCKYCNTEFITEKAINNYNTYIFNEHHHNTYITDSKGSLETRLKNADVFLSIHKDYAKAVQCFAEISYDTPADYRGWWGLVRARTHDFESFGCMDEVTDYYNKALNTAPVNVINDIGYTWKLYKKRADEYFGLIIAMNGMNTELRNLKIEKAELEDEFPDLRKEGIKEILKNLLYAVAAAIVLYIGNHYYKSGGSVINFNSSDSVFGIAFFALGSISLIYFAIDTLIEIKEIKEYKQEIQSLSCKYRSTAEKISETEKKIESLKK